MVDAGTLLELPKAKLLHHRAQPDNIAWIVYTSGSTGVPKGVALEHAALCTSIKAHGSAFRMDSNTRAIQFAAHTFDATIHDVFTTLILGGCVCIPSEHSRINNLTRVMDDMKVNFAMFTSTVASMLVPTEVPTLCTLLLVGEAVTPTAVGLWKDPVTIFNPYGPSECSIHSSCSKPVEEPSQALNIGGPLRCCRFWIVNPNDYHVLCPIGAPGELLIEGTNQARGYLNDEAKTKAGLVTDPAFIEGLGLPLGRRLYRTGDLVRQNEDGSLDYIG